MSLLYFSGSTYTMYAGDTYAGRSDQFDEVHTIDGTYTLSGTSEITFEKYSGKANPSGTVTIAHPEVGSVSIVVNSAGGISVQ